MGETMLNHVIKKTDDYIASKPKDVRKSFGQFFTSKATARYMAELLCIPKKEIINILDPGAGTGILSAAVLEVINKSYQNVKEVNLTCYETNSDIVPLLEANIEYMKSSSHFLLKVNIIKENYIISQAIDFNGSSKLSTNHKFDIIVGNPPYFKLAKDSPEALSMPEVCYGAPNIYFLFAAMSLFNLSKNGEMVYIIPRSWTSGAYFTKFRNYLLLHGKLTDIHIFSSRKKVFDKENVLQETMIIKMKKTSKNYPTIQITSSEGSDCYNTITKMNVPYNMIVSGKEQYVYLITSIDEADVLQKVNSFKNPLPFFGLKMKTGLTVDFRNRELLRNEQGTNIVPLFYSQHIKEGRVLFPIGKENEYITDELPGMVQHNRNYLFIKRFTTKEERRRLQCAVYLSNQYPEYKKISTQNKLNFIDTIDNTEMSDELVSGLYIIFNSTLYDIYYRILNGSTQVNSTEINTIPVPCRDDLIEMGKRLLNHNDYSTEFCDSILEEYIYA